MDQLEFILTIVATVIGIPMVFQMICGKPNIEAEYHRSAPESEHEDLTIILRNTSVSNFVLKKLWVTRTKAVIRGRYIIKNLEGQYLEFGPLWIRLNYKDPEIVVHLEEHEWAVINCVHKMREDNFICSGICQEAESIRFQQGRYTYHLELDCSGDKKSFTRDFIFGLNGLAWYPYR